MNPYMPPAPQHQKQSGRGASRVLIPAGTGIFGLILGIVIGAAGHTATPTAASTPPAVTAQTSGPATSAPADTTAPAPAANTTIAKYSGTGNEATPTFNVPSDGDYIIAWSYYGNSDSYGGTNFAITENGSGLALGLPNDIASSGHGSTEITMAQNTDSFNVQAVGHWTITIKTAG